MAAVEAAAVEAAAVEAAVAEAAAVEAAAVEAAAAAAVNAVAAVVIKAVVAAATAAASAVEAVIVEALAVEATAEATAVQGTAIVDAAEASAIEAVDKDRYIEHLVEVDDRCKPAVGKDARVGHDKKCARYFVAEVDLARGYLKCAWGYDVLQLEHTLLVYLLGQNRRQRCVLRTVFWF